MNSCSPSLPCVENDKAHYEREKCRVKEKRDACQELIDACVKFSSAEICYEVSSESFNSVLGALHMQVVRSNAHLKSIKKEYKWTTKNNKRNKKKGRK